MRKLFNSRKFAAAIKRHLARVPGERPTTFRAAAREIGISHATLNRAALGKTPDVETYLRIAKWLGDER